MNEIEPNSGTIYKRMAAILADFPAVSKDNTNPDQRYKYRGVDDAMQALHPLLARHGVFLQLKDLEPEFQDAGATKAGASKVRCIVKGKVRFVAEDGSYTEASLIGEGIDTQDKAMMKAQANGLKYVIWYTFSVPTDEVKDSEAYSDDEDKAPARTKKAAPKAEPSVAPAGNGEPPLIEGGVERAIARVQAADAATLQRMKAGIRDLANSLPAGSPERKRLVDEFKAAEARAG